VKVGVKIPGEDFADDFAAIRDFAQAAEGLGYAHVLAYDHILGAEHANRTPPLTVPYDETTYFHEPFVLFGYLAGFTTTIELVTGVIILPERQTALVAKQAAEVALLSDERLRLGVGVGWNYVEYEGLNEDFSTRGARQEEQIGLLRKLWTEPVVEYRGRFHTIDRLAVLPRPRSVIPIWIGGFSEAAYRRAARVADGFLYSLIGTAGPENDPRGTVEHLKALVGEAGRDPSGFGIDLIVPVAVEARELAGLVETWRGAGISHLTLHTYRPGATAAETIDLLGEYQRVIG
jgi:probable F420-dependent oxidoreductase